MTPRPVARPRARLSRVALATCTALTVVCQGSPLSAQAPPVPPARLAAAQADTVRLHFDWPVGMTASVEQFWMRTRTTGARSDTVRLPSTYRIQVLAHPKGRLVRTDRFTLPGAGGAGGAGGGQQEAVQRLSASLAGMQPSFVVNDSGEFVQVEDVARMKAALDSIISPMMQGMASAPPQLRSFMAQVTSEEALAASAAQEWNALAGTWIGAVWEVGEVYETRVDEPIAILPGLQVPVVYEFSATGRVPCEEGAPAGGCVALEMRSSPDSVGMRSVLERLMKEMGGPQGEEVAAMIGGMRVENELSVVADPRTLRPYQVTRVRRSTVRPTGAGVAAGAEATGIEQSDVRMTRFRYGAAAGR